MAQQLSDVRARLSLLRAFGFVHRASDNGSKHLVSNAAGWARLNRPPPIPISSQDIQMAIGPTPVVQKVFIGLLLDPFASVITTGVYRFGTPLLH